MFTPQAARPGRATQCAVTLALTFAMVMLGLACSNDDTSTSASLDPTSETVTSPAIDEVSAADLPDVVVTYSVLAAVVRDLVDGVADVVTIIPDGQDPHDFEPSAKDLEMINDAVVVVANGLQFEEGLETPLEQLQNDGGSVFFVGEHITVREMSDEDGHRHGGVDPHLWLSPGAMLEMLPALAAKLATTLSINLDTSLADVTAGLTALDEEIAALIANIAKCELVTGHDELGYFADRYGCETIGAVVPSGTTTSEASAGELAELKTVIAEHRATVVFTSHGTPQDVAAQVAKETASTLVELSTHMMGDADSYADFVRAFARQIVDALA